MSESNNLKNLLQKYKNKKGKSKIMSISTNNQHILIEEDQQLTSNRSRNPKTPRTKNMSNVSDNINQEKNENENYFINKICYLGSITSENNATENYIRTDQQERNLIHILNQYNGVVKANEKADIFRSLPMTSQSQENDPGALDIKNFIKRKNLYQNNNNNKIEYQNLVKSAGFPNRNLFQTNNLETINIDQIAEYFDIRNFKKENPKKVISKNTLIEFIENKIDKLRSILIKKDHYSQIPYNKFSGNDKVVVKIFNYMNGDILNFFVSCKNMNNMIKNYFKDACNKFLAKRFEEVYKNEFKIIDKLMIFKKKKNKRNYYN